MGAGEQFFTSFVDALNTSETRHVFLRGHGVFPSIASGSDVDMLVHPRDRSSVESDFRRIAGELGFHVWQRSRSGFLTRLFAYAFDAEGQHVFIDFDIHTSEASFGIPYLTAEALLDHSVERGGLRCLPLPMEAAVNGLGHLFMGGAIPSKYHEAWREAGTTEDSIRLVQTVAGSKDAGLILASLEQQQDLSTVGPRVRRRLFRRNPLRSLFGFIAFGFGERIKPWFSPRGRFLIFAGTDGSGKTTLVKELIDRVGPRFRDGEVEQHHLRPKVLPQISSLFHGGKPAYSIEDMDDPHRSPPSGFLGSCLRTMYYWVDYLVGYPMRILPRRRRNTLTVYDRWFYDHVVDPRRFRIASGHPLPGFLQRFLAKPDCLFVCTAKPEKILERKQELAPEEVARQVEKFQEFAAAHPKATLVDTTGEVDDCVDQIIQAVFGGAAA